MENERENFDKIWEMVQRHQGLVIAPNQFNLRFFAYTYDPRCEMVHFVSDLRKMSNIKQLTRKDFRIAWEKLKGIPPESEEEGVIHAIIRIFRKSS